MPLMSQDIKMKKVKAGIALDSWKLKTFKKVFDDAGYEYTQHEGVTKDTIALIVETDNLVKLQSFVKKANKKAAKYKKYH